MHGHFLPQLTQFPLLQPKHAPAKHNRKQKAKVAKMVGDTRNNSVAVGAGRARLTPLLTHQRRSNWRDAPLSEGASREIVDIRPAHC